MAHSAFTVGEVIQPRTVPGFAVRVTRYPSGRKLPAPRILVHKDGSLFTTGLEALDVLGAYTRGEGALEVRPIRASDAPAKPSGNLTASAPAYHVEPNHELDHELERVAKARAKRVRDQIRARAANLPKVEKLLTGAPSQNVRRDKGQLEIAMLLDRNLVTITRCPDGARQWDSKW